MTTTPVPTAAQRQQAIADALPITHPGSSFGKSTTATRTRYGHDFPASKAETAHARYLYLETMEAILDGTVNQVRLEVAAETARRARNSREARAKIMDMAMDPRVKPADATFARETARTMDAQAYGMEMAVLLALGVKPESIAGADWPAITDAVFVRRAQAR